MYSHGTKSYSSKYSASPDLNIKLFVHNNEIRRMKLKNNVSYDQMKSKVKEHLNQKDRNRNFVLEYFDGEDWVRFDSEQEWKDAAKIYYQLCNSNPTYALKVRFIVQNQLTDTDALTLIQRVPTYPVEKQKEQEPKPMVFESFIKLYPSDDEGYILGSDESDELDRDRRTPDALKEIDSPLERDEPSSLLDTITSVVSQVASGVAETLHLTKPFDDTEMLGQLRDMGFLNEQENKRLLSKHNHNLEDVVSELASQ
ncbi:hypothetical protein AKO1_005910 [Acrasis kona]|uniref:UBA domain-containing protein n=1 Tax=Acrasis kona TaxID=1008807 RepID=A0AAW2YJC4_9EUKA